MKTITALLLATVASTSLHAADPIKLKLWPDQPGTKSAKGGYEPSITIHQPEKPNGVAVLVVPGGGYGTVCLDTEGDQILPYLLPRGITAAILHYRLPDGENEVPGDDARRALSLLRSKSKELDLNTKRIGVWGFSAGGHLAATLVNHGKPALPDAKDPVLQHSSIPNFAILFYPVISMEDGVTHKGSQLNLLGKEPDAALLEKYSLEKQVREDHPVTFLLHATDDGAVPIENSLRYAAALEAKGVPFDLHAYGRGGHGPGAFRKNPGWEAAFDVWLERYKVVPAKE